MDGFGCYDRGALEAAPLFSNYWEQPATGIDAENGLGDFSMFSLDIFSIVESVLAATLGFFQSLIISIYLLLRRPLVASRLLSRRLKDPNKRQAGPLTICFVFVLLGFGFQLIWRPVSIKSLLGYVLVEEQKSTFVTYIGSGFAGVIVIDLYSRICVALGWPWDRRNKFKSTFKSERSNTKKTVLNYLLVTPVIIASTCLVIAPITGLIPYYIWNFIIPTTGVWDIIGRIAIAVGIAWMCLSIALIRIVAPHFVLGAPIKHSKKFRLHQRLASEAVIPILWLLVAVAVYQANHLIPKYNPTLKGYVSELSYLKSEQLECKILPENTFMSKILLTNMSDQPITIKFSGVFRIIRIDPGTENVTDSEDRIERIEINNKDEDGSASYLTITPRSATIKKINTTFERHDPAKIYRCGFRFESLDNQEFETVHADTTD